MSLFENLQMKEKQNGVRGKGCNPVGDAKVDVLSRFKFPQVFEKTSGNLISQAGRYTGRMLCT